MRLGVRAVSLDVGAQRVALGDGTSVDYDRLIVATGTRVRTLPGIAGRAGLHVLRGLDDASALRRDWNMPRASSSSGPASSGSKSAASCRARGLQVTAIEAMPQVLAPPLGQDVCDMVEALHRDHGVDLRTATTVTDVMGDARVTGVRLSDGSSLDADVVVVGIGVIPNTEWLEGSGVTLSNGVVCSDAGEAAPNVYAAGDVARIPNAWLGEAPRIEHWTSAVEQAAYVAERVLAGRGVQHVLGGALLLVRPVRPQIQFDGRARPGDDVVVVDGSIEERRLTALYRRGDRLVACLAVNQPRAFIKYRKLLAAGASWDAAVSGAAAS